VQLPEAFEAVSLKSSKRNLEKEKEEWLQKWKSTNFRSSTQQTVAIPSREGDENTGEAGEEEPQMGGLCDENGVEIGPKLLARHEMNHTRNDSTNLDQKADESPVPTSSPSTGNSSHAIQPLAASIEAASPESNTTPVLFSDAWLSSVRRSAGLLSEMEKQLPRLHRAALLKQKFTAPATGKPVRLCYAFLPLTNCTLLIVDVEQKPSSLFCFPHIPGDLLRQLASMDLGSSSRAGGLWTGIDSDGRPDVFKLLPFSDTRSLIGSEVVLHAGHRVKSPLELEQESRDWHLYKEIEESSAYSKAAVIPPSAAPVANHHPQRHNEETKSVHAVD
jgi:hypothetical protein